VHGEQPIRDRANFLELRALASGRSITLASPEGPGRGTPHRRTWWRSSWLFSRSREMRS
jgi:hypothetical protein